MQISGLSGSVFDAIQQVNAWAVGKCLEQISQRANEESPTHCKRLSSRHLRRYLILRSLSRKVDERAIRKHVRSNYAVNVLSVGLDDKDASMATSLNI